MVVEFPMHIAWFGPTHAGGTGLIVTVVEQVAVLPHASVAVHVTIVFPTL
jgi:hypothetical protein